MAPTTDPTKLWFRQLQKIQDRLKDLNHLTESGLKKFSKQKLGDLLLTDVMKGNLSQFCQNERIGIVPNTAFSDPAKTFQWFLTRISFSAEGAILTLCFTVAAGHKPALLDKTRNEVAKMTIDEIFGTDPLNSNPPKRDLHAAMTRRIPGDFYPADGSLIDKKPSQKLSEVIAAVFS